MVKGNGCLRLKMNAENYTSLEMSRKLHEAGIVLETEVYHRVTVKGSYLTHRERLPEVDKLLRYNDIQYYPAPSMSELWRQLPERFENYLLQAWRHNGITYCSYLSLDTAPGDRNPADALAELLIWVSARRAKI